MSFIPGFMKQQRVAVAGIVTLCSLNLICQKFLLNVAGCVPCTLYESVRCRSFKKDSVFPVNLSCVHFITAMRGKQLAFVDKIDF
jgi:hypothetical protein